jgi:hypothetical protein
MSSPAPGETRSAFLGLAWKAVASLAALGALVLGIGFVLPGTWSTERSVVIAAPPDSIFPWIDSPRRWDRWTQWGGIASTFEGPDRGEGARRTWDDPYMGDGAFTITSAEGPRRLAYRVEVEGGSMRTEGSFTLRSSEGGTTVVWREAGDLGRNPLMGYAALNMDRLQGTELERGLRRLKLLVETGELPDSLRLPDVGPTTPRPPTPR